MKKRVASFAYEDLTLRDILVRLEKKEFSSEELVDYLLKRIEKYNPLVRGFISINSKAREQAVETDSLRKKGVKKPLLGVPIAIKDNFLTKDLRTTSASKVLDDFVPQYDATVVSKLKDAGAIIIGKTNLDAWGHGSSGEHTDYGVTRNPYAYNKVTGGSSSGSAVAVASGFCYMGTGSDTGGSNRQPGSYCNVVGLKPTYGRTSRYGVIAMASSTDSIGTLTKSVWDCALCLWVMAGADPFDATSSSNTPEKYHELLESKAKLKVGLVDEYFGGLDKEVSQATLVALKLLEKKGHKIVKISLPKVKYAYPMYCLTTFAEISSNLAKFDGVRYGANREKFGEETVRRIMIGTHSASAGYRDQYYDQAMKARTLLAKDFEEAFKKVDIIAGAVFPFPPFGHGERETDPLKMYLSDVLTVPANLTGHPAMTVPIEFVKGLPNGLQLIAPHFNEVRLLQMANIVEEEYQMYKVRPKLKEKI